MMNMHAWLRIRTLWTRPQGCRGCAESPAAHGPRPHGCGTAPRAFEWCFLAAPSQSTRVPFPSHQPPSSYPVIQKPAPLVSVLPSLSSLSCKISSNSSSGPRPHRSLLYSRGLGARHSHCPFLSASRAIDPQPTARRFIHHLFVTEVWPPPVRAGFPDGEAVNEGETAAVARRGPSHSRETAPAAAMNGA